MKPVAILQHEAHMGPGSLHDCLQELAVPLQLIRPDKGEAIPQNAREFSGIVLLGSERSVLDTVHWIRGEVNLCQDSLEHEVPVLGLGFGAQVLATAAGGKVKPIHSPSYGWVPSLLTPEASARFGVPAKLEIFNAHQHSLELPEGAESFLSDRRCLNKGFSLGIHLGFLCPLELTPLGLAAWCNRKGTKLALAQGPEVQNRISMQRALPERMGTLYALATHVFAHWAQQLPGAPRPRDTQLAA